MTGLVQGQHHISAARELDSKTVLRLTRIKITMNRKNAWCGRFCGSIGRDVKQPTHPSTVGPCKTNILDANAAGGLDGVRQPAPQQHHYGTDNDQARFMVGWRGS